MTASRASSDLDLYEIAYLAGGPERAVDTALVALVQTGRIRVHSPGRFAAVGLTPPAPVEAAVLDAIGQAGHRSVDTIRGGWPTTSGSWTSRTGCARAGLLPPRRGWLGHRHTADRRLMVRTAPVAGHAARLPPSRPRTRRRRDRRRWRSPSAAATRLPDRELCAADLRGAAGAPAAAPPAAASPSRGEAAAEAWQDTRRTSNGLHSSYNEWSAVPETGRTRASPRPGGRASDTRSSTMTASARSRRLRDRVPRRRRQRVVDTALVALVESGRVRVHAPGELAAAEPARRHPVEAAVLDAVGTHGHRSVDTIRWRLARRRAAHRPRPRPWPPPGCSRRGRSAAAGTWCPTRAGRRGAAPAGRAAARRPRIRRGQRTAGGPARPGGDAGRASCARRSSSGPRPPVPAPSRPPAARERAPAVAGRRPVARGLPGPGRRGGAAARVHRWRRRRRRGF